MTKTSLKLFLPILLLAALFITSCSDEDTSISEQEVENYTEDAVYNRTKSTFFVNNFFSDPSPETCL